jgi:hypothetical protein
MIDEHFEPALARLEVRLLHAAAARFLFPEQRDVMLDALYALRRQHWVPSDFPTVSRAGGQEHPNAKLTWPAVLAIRASSEGARTLATRFGVSHGTIWYVRRGRTWKERAA